MISVNRRSLYIMTLTMQTGLNFENGENTAELFNYQGNSLEFVLHRNLDFEPGTNFYYHDGNPQLISGVIQKVSGMTEEEFAVKNLFNPLGIDYYRWEKPADGKNLRSLRAMVKTKRYG